MKIVTLLAVFFIFVCTGCSQEEEKEVKHEDNRAREIIIVAVGDSLTAGYGLDEKYGYPAILGKKLENEGYYCRVINSGVSSETSSGTLSRIDWVLGMKPDIVILETGANDGLRGIDPEIIEKNIRHILVQLKEAEVVTVLTGMKMAWNLGPLYVKNFNDIYPRLADEFESIFMPFFLEGVAMKPELTISDGLHPNAKGYEIIADKIYPYVLEAMKKRQSSHEK